MINFLKFPKQIVQWKSLEIKLNYIKLSLSKVP